MLQKANKWQNLKFKTRFQFITAEKPNIAAELVSDFKDDTFLFSRNLEMRRFEKYIKMLDDVEVLSLRRPYEGWVRGS